MVVPLDRQVTSLALSKRLAAALGKQKTLWAWSERRLVENNPNLIRATRKGETPNAGLGWKRLPRTPAWTTDELLEWLRTMEYGRIEIRHYEQTPFWGAECGTESYTNEALADWPAEALGELALKVKEER